jgi:zinc protease
MWVVIVGDVDAESALAAVKKYMGNAPAMPLPVQKIPQEPVQDGMREKVEFADLQHSYIRMGWKVPGIESQDRFPLYVISNLVGGGESSWLWKELVERDQIAISAGSGFYSSQFPMLFQVGGLTSPGKARQFTEAARKVIYRLIGGEISSEELEKAKQQIIAADIFGRETVEDQATNYGHFAMLADVFDADSYANKIREVSIEGIRGLLSVFQ